MFYIITIILVSFWTNRFKFTSATTWTVTELPFTFQVPSEMYVTLKFVIAQFMMLLTDSLSLLFVCKHISGCLKKKF